MNAYDFDKTIFRGNSVRSFCMFCMVRFPYLWLLLPWYLIAVVLRGLRIINKHAFLDMLEIFILFVPCRQRFVDAFWSKSQKRIQSWYLAQKVSTDVIISASPDYLIAPICARLGVSCIASPTRKNGTVRGKHCYGEVKVTMFCNVFTQCEVDEFYSDSFSDAPMMKFARRGFLVSGNKIRQVYLQGERIEYAN